MFSLLLQLLLYIIFIILLSSIYSIFYGKINSFPPLNSESGYLAIMLLTIKYKFNYQMIIIHSPHYEQELLSIIIEILWCVIQRVIIAKIKVLLL